LYAIDKTMNAICNSLLKLLKKNLEN